MGDGFAGIRATVLALGAGSAALALAACHAPSTGSTETDTGNVAAFNCIGFAMQGTAFSNKAGTDLAGAFAAQGLGDCPADFIQQFTITANAINLVVAAQNELQAHLGKEDEARQNSALSMAGDVWNGKPSGKTILTDWQERKARLDEQLSDKRTAYEEAKAALITTAARYGIYPEQQGADARATDDAATSNAAGSTGNVQ